MSGSNAAPMLAFVCGDADDENQRIVFAVSGAAARATHADADSLITMKVARSPGFDAFAPGPVPVSAMLDEGWYSHCASSACGRRISYDEGEWAGPGRDPSIRLEAEETARRERDVARWLKDNPQPVDAPEGSDWKDVAAAKRAKDDWHARRRWAVREPEPAMLDRNALRFMGSDVYCCLACQQGEALKIARTDLAHADAEAEAERRWPGAPEYVSGRWPQLQPRVRFRPPVFAHDVHWHADEDQSYVMPEDVPLWEAMRAAGNEAEKKS